MFRIITESKNLKIKKRCGYSQHGKIYYLAPIMRKLLSRLFWSTASSKEKIEKYQKIIRDHEWNAFKEYIIENGTLLDVGCGAGYYLHKAKVEFNCEIQGIDPNPREHGVGRYNFTTFSEIEITEGYSEKMPFKEKSFDTILCSHVLEHVKDESQSLKEINRVLNDNGILIIAMPTALMSVISYVSKLIFKSHINALFFLKNFGKKDTLQRFWTIFVPLSHSYPRATTIFHDLNHYRVENWKKIVSKEFQIIKEIKPFLYPYPEHPQIFKIHKSKLGSSSVIFICKKKSQ